MGHPAKVPTSQAIGKQAKRFQNYDQLKQEDRNMRGFRALLLAAIFMGRACGQDSPCRLPAPLARVVTENWKGWRLMQLSDLRSDDQRIWRRKWGERCPGLASGHFVHPGSLSYAVSLIDPKESRQAIILATPIDGGSFTIHTLSPPSRVLAFSVLHTLPAGKYQEVEDEREVRTKLDSVAYETIEAGMVMFYEDHGLFRSLQLSN